MDRRMEIEGGDRVQEGPVFGAQKQQAETEIQVRKGDMVVPRSGRNKARRRE